LTLGATKCQQFRIPSTQRCLPTHHTSISHRFCRLQELTGSNLASALRNSGRVTATEADYIAAHYDRVATQMSGGYGFQAMVFRRKPPTGQPGDYVLAIRGSQEGVDFLQGAELTLFAGARDQAAAMYSFISSGRVWWLWAPGECAI